MREPEQGAARVRPYGELPSVWRTCLEQAWEAFLNGSLPIGAVILGADGQVLAVGRNRLGESGEHAPHVNGTPYIEGPPLAHAEVNAILQLGNRRTEPRPVLYTTTEPCPLCMGASRMAGLGRVVFASRDEWAGAAVMAERIPYLKEMGPSVEGPIADLELPPMTWLLAAHGNQQVRSGSFIDRWRERHPLAAEVGSRLNTSQALRDVAVDGVEAVWSVLAAELGSTD